MASAAQVAAKLAARIHLTGENGPIEADPPTRSSPPSSHRAGVAQRDVVEGGTWQAATRFSPGGTGSVAVGVVSNDIIAVTALRQPVEPGPCRLRITLVRRRDGHGQNLSAVGAWGCRAFGGRRGVAWGDVAGSR
ncbi:hypothetical protein GCM10020220_031100 [Nonomuraea rubra]